MPSSSAASARRKTAVESFGNAALTIGECRPGMALFAVTRGQWSMIDAILHVIDQVGICKISIWTWTAALHDVSVLTKLRENDRVKEGLLVVEHTMRNMRAYEKISVIGAWKDVFGPTSVRYCKNHAKIATVESADGLKFLLRGSMNLNKNPHFEQFDITEGGEDFNLVKRLEVELLDLPDNCSSYDCVTSSKVADRFDAAQLQMFKGCQIWSI